MNKNTKMILLFILLLQLMIGIACASEVQNEQDNTIEKQAQQTINPSSQEINNNIKTSQKTIKTNNNKNVKTANNTNTRKRNVKITVDSISGIVGENITLKANITDNEDKPVTGGNLVFKLNSKTLKKDGSFSSSETPWKFLVKNGKVRITITADLYLRNIKNITAIYSGTKQYTAAKSRIVTAQIKKRNAQLTVTATPKKQKHYETITIKTIIKDTTLGHKNKTVLNTGSKVLFKIDGKTLKNNKGKKILVEIENNRATYNYTIPQVMKAINNDGTTKNHTIEAVLVSDIYYQNKNHTKFSVYRNPTKIILNNITNATVKKNVKITGKLVDIKNQPVISKKIQLKINNQKYIIKTDKTGAFQKTIKANKTGTNNITVISPGNANYLSTKTKTTFKVNRIKTLITFKILNESKLRAGKSICVRGKITDEDGNPVKEEFIYVYPSLSEYKIRYGQYGYIYQWITDEKGKFDCENTLLSAGSNQLIVVFEGNEIFAPAKRIKNYTSAKFRPELYIETYDIMPLKVGETINIYGKIIPTDAYYGLDELYIDLNNITLEARFNNENKTQKAKLKDDGSFDVYYKTNLVGTNKVTIKLSENQEFHETINSTTFYVYNKTASKVVLPIKKHRSEISNEYEKYIIYNNGNKDYGEIEAQVNNLVIYDALPVNKIVGAKLYLKNSKNQTKTINGTIEDKFSVVIKHDPKLTPYKIELQLKQLSKREDAEYFY